MTIDENIVFYNLTKKEFNSLNQDLTFPIKLVRKQISETKTKQANLPIVSPDITITLIPLLSITVVGIIVGFKLLRFRKFDPYKMINFIRFHQAPCKSCEFFQENPHFKCAVNPSVVLTQEALNCPDYCPHDKHWFLEVFWFCFHEIFD